MPEHTPAPTPDRAVYGYAFYILMFSLFVFYVLWALFPTKEWGLIYLPDRYFAILLPMLFLVGISFFVFFFYPAVNISLLPKIDDLRTTISPDIAVTKYKGREKTSLTWDEMRNVLEAPLTSADNEESNNPLYDHLRENTNTMENCNCCGDFHRYSMNSTNRVDPKYFIDLANVNKNLFD